MTSALECIADYTVGSHFNWLVLTFYLSSEIKYILFSHVGEPAVWPIITNS